MPNCKGCGAEIIWGVTAKNNRAIPLNAKPETRAVMNGRAPGDGAPIVEIRTTFMPHHATCSKVEDFRNA